MRIRQIQCFLQNLLTVVILFSTIVGLTSCVSNSLSKKNIISSKHKNLTKFDIHLDSIIASKKAKDYVIRGSSLQMREQYAEAILEFQMALRYDTSAVIYYALAKNYTSLAKFDLAAENARIAIQIDSSFIPALELLADIYNNSDRSDEANEIYEKIVELEPENKGYIFALAQSCEIRNPRRAEELYLHLLIGEEDEGTLYTLAQLYRRNKQYEKYIFTLERLYSVTSDNRVAYMLVNSYLRQQNYDKAIELSFKLEQSLPSDDIEDYYQVISSSLLDNSDSLLLATPSITNYLEKLSHRHSFEWRYYYNNGLLASQIEKQQLAETFFKRAISLDTTIELPLRLAAYYLQRKNYEATIELLVTFENLFPLEARIPLYIGIAFSGINKYDLAIPFLKKSILLNNENIDGWAQLGIAYDHLNISDSSDLAYENALKIDSSNALINNNYAYSLSIRNLKLSRALEMASTAINAQPNNSSYLDTFGWVHFQLGNYKEALENLIKASTNTESSATILEHLGDAYLKNGNVDQAISTYRKALEKSPDRRSLLERLENIYK